MGFNKLGNDMNGRRRNRRTFQSCCGCTIAFVSFVLLGGVLGQTPPTTEIVRAKPGQFKALTEPPCSYCSTQHRKGLIRRDDRVLAWLRAAHNGGAVPLRHFLSRRRVINDTYGLFFYDPDADTAHEHMLG